MSTREQEILKKYRKDGPPASLMAQNPDAPESPKLDMFGRPIPEGMMPFGEAVDQIPGLIGEKVGQAAALPGIKQVLGGLGWLMNTPPGRAVQAVSTTPPSLALAFMRQVKGEQGFGEAVGEAFDRYKAHQNVGYQDVAKELVPDFPGSTVLEGSLGLAGDIFLDPANALRLGGLGKAGVAAKNLGKSGKTAEEILNLAKAADASPEVKAMADLIRKEGDAAFDFNNLTRADKIRRGYQHPVTLSNPIKPFAQDAPLVDRGFDKINQLEGAAAEFGGKGVAAFQKTPFSEAVSRVFSTRPRRTTDVDPADFNAVNDEFTRAQQMREAYEYKGRKAIEEIALGRNDKRSIRDRVMAIFDAKSRQINTSDDQRRLIRLRDEPYATDDVLSHDQNLEAVFGTTDPAELAQLQYSPARAGDVETTVQKMSNGLRLINEGLQETPDDVKLLAAKQSLESKLSIFDAWHEPLDEQDVGRMAESLTAEADKVDETLAGIDAQMKETIGESDRIRKDFDTATFPAAKEQHVKAMNELGERSAAMAKERDRLIERQADLRRKAEKRTKLEADAADEIETLSAGDEAQLMASDVLKEVSSEADEVMVDYKKRLNYGQYFNPEKEAGGLHGNRAAAKRAETLATKRADKIRTETLTDRAKRLSGGDPVKEARLLADYVTEARTRGTVTGTPMDFSAKPAVIADPPAPNETVKPTTPERADGSFVVEEGKPVKPAKAGPDDVKKAVEANQSVLDIARRTAVKADGSFDEAEYKRMADELGKDAPARENMARESAWQVMRNVTDEERKMAFGPVKDFFDDMYVSRETAGILGSYLHNYLPMQHAKGKNLRWFANNAAKRGDIPTQGFMKQRTLGESIQEYNDAARRAGATDKVVNDDLLTMMGVHARGTAATVSAKIALNNIAKKLGLAVNKSSKDMIDAIGPRAALMRKKGTYSGEHIRIADELDKRTAWVELSGGRHKVGKMLQDISKPGLDRESLTLNMKRMLAAKWQGKSMSEAMDWHPIAGTQSPIQRWTREGEREINGIIDGLSDNELREAGKMLEDELYVAQKLRPLYGPDVAMFVPRFSLDNLAAMTDEELKDLGIESFEAVRRLANSQEAGKYIVSVDRDLVPVMSEMARRGKVDAYLFDNQVATQMNEHIHRFNDTDMGMVGQTLAPVRRFISGSTLMPFMATHMANLAGGAYNAVFLGGMRPTALDDGLNVMRGLSKKTFKNIYGDVLTADQMKKLIVDSGAVSGGFANVERIEDAEKAWRFSKNPWKRMAAVPGEYFSYGENWMRSSYFIDQWEKGLDGFNATKEVNRIFHDYSDLTNTEKHIRNVMPFYAFTRKQPPLVFQEWAKRPYLTGLNEKITSAMQTTTGQEVTGEERVGKPKYLRERDLVKVGTNDYDETMWAPADVFMPTQPATDIIELAKVAAFRDGNLDAAEFLARMVGPHVRGPIELATGRRLDTGGEIEKPGQYIPFMGLPMPKWMAQAGRSFRPFRAIDDAAFGYAGTADDPQKKKSAMQRALALAGYSLYNINAGDEAERRAGDIDKLEGALVQSNDNLRDMGDSPLINAIADMNEKNAESRVDKLWEEFYGLESEFGQPERSTPATPDSTREQEILNKYRK